MRTMIATIGVAFLLLLHNGPSAAGPPWNWDLNLNDIDDHIEAVEQQGITGAYEDGDLTKRQIIDVTESGGVFSYGIYVRYDHRPTPADETALNDMGLTTRSYLYIDYVRSRATYPQIQQILGLPGVVRVEGLHIMYPVNDNATKSMRAAASTLDHFPSVTGELGITGRGVVIAILDTGVNDAPDSTSGYPGHESLIGKFVGGGNFSSPDPTLNTRVTESENPVDRSPDLSHGSHVAGTAMGSGGPTGLVSGGSYGYYRGVAPDARLADCKVLTDAGRGFGTAEGVEWCIYHKDDDWGLTGPDSIYRGIQVMNLSLSGAANSDGTDASSMALNAAVKAGIVVCASTSNSSAVNSIPSPGAADLALSIGAAIDFNTLSRPDDRVADFSNEGPRRADADADSLDEMKPSVCPPGAGITSAEGVLTANGRTYVTINGTSMSSPMATGLCALIIQACPGIPPGDVRDILQDTADHLKAGGKQAPGAFPGYQRVDPNYHPSWGWGNPDAYAAVIEARFPNRTQVIRISGKAVPGGVDVAWTTQREVDLLGFHILRADPLNGSRGPFRRITSSRILPAGDPFIHRDDNRTAYLYQDRDPSLVPGETYWYRVQWQDARLLVHDEPAFPAVYDPPVPVATLHWSITHNTPDNDLLVFMGSGSDAGDPVNTALFLVPAPGSGAEDSVKVLTGEATTGNRQHFWHLTLTDRDFGAAQFLPPGPENPWFLSVEEAGFVNRLGRVNHFRIVHHTPAGDVTYTSPQPVTPTVERQTTVFWIPLDPATNLNQAPVLHPVGNREAVEGRPLEFTISGEDADGDPLTFSAPELPPGASFDPATRTFSWSPGFDAVTGVTPFNATFLVSDGTTTDAEQIRIRLHDVDPGGNLPPYWNPLNDPSVIQGNRLAFKVSAVDPEGGPLTYGATGLPSGATFDAAGRCFEWQTGDGDAGDYTVTFNVDDGTHPAVSEEVLVTVKAPAPPLFGACEPSSFSFSGTSDVGSADLGTADRDTIPFTIPRPANRIFARLSWTGGPDIDFTLQDQNGNVLDGGATLANPEFVLADNVPAGSYRFVIVGFTVAAPADWTLDMEQCILAPVAVALSHFEAHPAEDLVRLEWATSAEEDHLGFRVYRSPAEDGDYALLSRDLVTGDGVYAFVDRDPPGLGTGTVWYRLGAVDRAGREEILGPWAVDLSGVRPTFRLAQNFPNPVASSTTRIRFRMAEAGRVRLDIFDVRGARVRSLIDGTLDRGDQEVDWDGTDDRGQRAAAGLYFYRMEVPGRYVETRRLVMIAS